MFDRLDPRALFLDHLAWIERAATAVCRKNSLWGDDAEEFVSLVKMRLMEEDYAAIAKFRGECEFTTYLTVVIVRLFHEHGRERWGRWRCSAAAERLGPLAKELETLVHRDGYRLEEAGEKLRTSRRTSASDTELARLLAQLPARSPLRPVEVGSEPLEWSPARSRADERVVAHELRGRRREVMEALARAVAGLDEEDRMIVRMHFADGRKVSDVARALSMDTRGQKALYRRIERLRADLRARLEGEGISEADARELLGAQAQGEPWQEEAQ